SAIGSTTDLVVLDVGGGTGSLAPYLSPGTRYGCADNDAAKLQRLRAKSRSVPAVLADATRLPFRCPTVAVLVGGSSLADRADPELDALVDELARITRRHVIVLDPLLELRSRRGRLLWSIDRGSFPRREDQLLAALTRRLEPVSSARHSKHHHYLTWIGRPR